MVGILQVKHPPHKFTNFQTKICNKYQHEERFQPRKCHIDMEKIRKCKFQMACNPSHKNHFLKKKNKFQQKHSTPINQNINTIPQQKAKHSKK